MLIYIYNIYNKTLYYLAFKVENLFLCIGYKTNNKNAEKYPADL